MVRDLVHRTARCLYSLATVKDRMVRNTSNGISRSRRPILYQHLAFLVACAFIPISLSSVNAICQLHSLGVLPRWIAFVIYVFICGIINDALWCLALKPARNKREESYRDFFVLAALRVILAATNPAPKDLIAFAHPIEEIHCFPSWGMFARLSTVIRLGRTFVLLDILACWAGQMHPVCEDTVCFIYNRALLKLEFWSAKREGIGLPFLAFTSKFLLDQFNRTYRPTTVYQKLGKFRSLLDQTEKSCRTKRDPDLRRWVENAREKLSNPEAIGALQALFDPLSALDGGLYKTINGMRGAFKRVVPLTDNDRNSTDGILTYNKSNLRGTGRDSASDMNSTKVRDTGPSDRDSIPYPDVSESDFESVEDSDEDDWERIGPH